MEQLLLLLQQIYRDLSVLSNYPPEEREERLEGYFQFLVETRDIIRVLNRIVEGSTSWGWKIDWGCLPWQLRTYRQQRGLTLQAGWEDKVDFGIELYRDRPVESLRYMVPTGPPETLKPEDLDVAETSSEIKTDTCQVRCIHPRRPVAFQEFIPIGSSSSSSSRSSSTSDEIGHPNETQELSVTAGDSDLDSMPELEDDIDSNTIEIPLWLIPGGVMIAFRGGRMVFEREQGPPWQEVLAQMLEEQEATATNNQ